MRSQSNILDPIHDTLDPRVWDKAGATQPVFKAKHAHWVKKQIFSVLDQAGYSEPEQWLTLCVTGSLTTYQYSDDSDFDVSLFVDSEKFPEWSRAELIGLMVTQLDEHFLPGTPFPIQAFVIPEGVKPHDIYRPGLRSAYDLDNNKWIVPPEKTRVHDLETEENGFYSWALQMADKMERLLRYEPKKAVAFWHAIHRRRKRDMQVGKGDTSASNIVYKFLAQRGLLPQIAQESGEYIAKTADLYHVAPTTERQRIQQHGLLPADPLENPDYQWDPRQYAGESPVPTGVYGWGNPDAAKEHAEYLEEHRGTPHDIWQFSDQGAVLDPDQDEDSWIVHHGVDPQLFEGPEHRWSKTAAHTLGYNREQHPEGKGFILDDGSVWTWPTENLKPMHMQYSMKAKQQGHQVTPGSAFHIKEGKVWQYGEGRNLTPEQQQAIYTADPTLEPAPARRQEELDTTPGFGHGQNVLDVLERQGSSPQTMYHVAPAHAEQVIAQGGLRGDPDEWDDMVWLHEKEEQARAYAQPEDHVYAVNTTGMESDPNHMLEPGMEHSWVTKGPIPPERIQRLSSSSKPPNLRTATGDHDCGNCWAFKKGHCSMYDGYVVREDQMCDSWEATKTSKVWTRVSMPRDDQFLSELTPEHDMEKGEEGFHVPVLRAIHPAHGEVGHIQHTEGDEFPPGILMMRTHEPYQRKGVGTWMMDRLQERYPDQPIDMGGYTDSGEPWARAYQGKEVGMPSFYVKDRQPLTEDEFYRTTASSSLHELIERIFTGTMQGGITVNLAGEEPTKRYGFAPDKSTEEKVPLKSVTEQDVESYIQHHLKELSQPEKYLGTWIKDGSVWFDVTEGHDDFQEAYKRAWNGDQRALYDSHAEEDIPVRDSGIPPVNGEEHAELADNSYN